MQSILRCLLPTDNVLMGDITLKESLSDRCSGINGSLKETSLMEGTGGVLDAVTEICRDYDERRQHYLVAVQLSPIVCPLTNHRLGRHNLYTFW